MKKPSPFIYFTFILLYCAPILTSAQVTQDKITSKAISILHRMSLKEKIGQKLMLDFRYWCPSKPRENQACTEDLTTVDPTIKQIISTNHIGGIILFSNNLKSIAQIATLTHDFQQAMTETNNLALLIGTDQEGGIVGRLPRDVSVSFPGNMAITAAYLGNNHKTYSSAVGNIIATDLKALGVNTNFAPDVDVNINPLNPVINVRSFSDDPQLVAKLGLALSKAIQEEGVAATLKHFPGHGDTIADSHVGLPVVEHDIDQAWKIDLYPFKNIIEQNSPDLIMTAHIQYPALDNSQIYASKSGKQITTPATLSRKIQYDLLRKQLNYQGIVITDALGMGAIAQNFDSTDATIKAFQAGDDIALMPIAILQPQDANLVSDLIAEIESAILNGTLSVQELDQSVLRILKLKIKLGLFKPDSTLLPEKIARAKKILADKNQYDLETALTNDAITLVQNTNNLVPIKLLPNTRVYILTPWLEQGAGIATEIKKLQKEHLLPQNLQITYVKMVDTDLEKEKKSIDKSDIVIVGNSTTKLLLSNNLRAFNLSAAPMQPQGSLVFPDMLIGDSPNTNASSHNQFQKFFAKAALPDDQFAYQALQYAKNQHKKTIFISLLAPYDLPNYANVSDVMLAGFDHYGYLEDQAHGYYRGPSLPAMTRIIFGINKASGRLPINVPSPSNPTEIFYKRGFGITTDVPS